MAGPVQGQSGGKGVPQTAWGWVIRELEPVIARILDAGRWAPSGDNAQPWTFQVAGPRDIDVDVFCDPDSVYEYHEGEPTLIAAGMLLENMRIAAGTLGRRLSWTHQGVEGAVHTLRLRLDDDEPRPDPLLAAIFQRSVDRRPYRSRPLDAASRDALERASKEAPGGAFRLEWFEGLNARLKIAGLMRIATDIRLRIPETFEIHRRIVDWNNKLSPHGIPASALGLDAMTVKMMRWSLAERSRTEMSNRLGSPSMASLQMDLIPAIFSAAFFAFRLPGRPSDPHQAAIQLFQLGQAVQRFWLTACALGLVLQPCFAPLAFSYYGRNAIAFTRSERERRVAGKLAKRLEQVFPKAEDMAFLGRIGWPAPRGTVGRSTRRPLCELVKARP